jgi:hypothetical protein
MYVCMYVYADTQIMFARKHARTHGTHPRRTVGIHGKKRKEEKRGRSTQSGVDAAERHKILTVTRRLRRTRHVPTHSRTD